MAVGHPIAVETANPADRIIELIRAGLNKLANVLDDHARLCVSLIVLFVVPLVVIEAHSHYLTNDEIYTAHIAQAPTISQMRALSREIDLHPPLHYLAEREALRTGLPRWEASRLPSELASMVLLFCLFFWTKRRLSNLFAMVAVGVFWISPAFSMAWCNRPYMIWLACIGLLLIARDVALRQERPFWAIPAVFVATLLMVMTHLLGIACIGPFLLAEAWRVRRSRQVDWPYVCALFFPSLYGLGFYYQIHHLSQNAFPLKQLPSFVSFSELYGVVVGDSFLVIGVCLLIILILFRLNDFHSEYQAAGAYSAEDLTLLLSLLAIPTAILGIAHVVHIQFWARYGFAAAPAWALLAVWMIARFLPQRRLVAAALMICFVGAMINAMVADFEPGTNANVDLGGRQAIPLASLDSTLPIVTASPMTFVEMSDREKPEIARRVVYLTDANAAMQYAHYTLFENEDKIARLLNLPSHAEPLQPFVRQHKQFYVVGNYWTPEVWLLRKLAGDGVQLDYLGKFQSTYQSDDLYLVKQ